MGNTLQDDSEAEIMTMIETEGGATETETGVEIGGMSEDPIERKIEIVTETDMMTALFPQKRVKRKCL